MQKLAFILLIWELKQERDFCFNYDKGVKKGVNRRR